MRIVLSLAVLVATFALSLAGSPAHAQNARSWVASTGSDNNPCTRASPCATFGQALLHTNASGEINCVDQGDFGGDGFPLNHSVTIDCEGVPARIATSTVGGIAIEVQAAASDVVVLRGLDISGNGSTAAGIVLVSAAALRVEKCVIHDFTGSDNFVSGGIVMQPSSAAELIVSDTIVANNGTGSQGAGILILPGSANVFKATLNRVEARGNFFGIKADGAFRPGAVVNMTIRDSVSSDNAANGIVGTGMMNGAAIVMMIDRSTSSHNTAGFGVIADGPKTTIRLGGSSIAGNPTGVGVSNGGVLQSYGTNQINGNSNDGIGALTPIGLH